jgi:hypothetical protein
VVGDSEGGERIAHSTSCRPKLVEGLGAAVLVEQMTIDVEEREPVAWSSTTWLSQILS